MLTRWIILLGVVFFSHPLAATQEPGEDGDDPAARTAYERARLRDPSTGRIPRSMRIRELDFARTIPTASSLRDLKGGADRTRAVAELAWSARGPANVGGRTRALAIDVTDANTILAGGVSGGMWRSVDGGATWTKVTEVSDLYSVTCIAQDRRPGHTDVWYYGTGETWGNSASQDFASLYAGDGIFKSTDNGATWAQLPSSVSGTPQTLDNFDFVYSIVTDPSELADDVVYAATYGAIKRSTDGGATWSTVLGDSAFAQTSSFFSDLAITSAGDLYATMSGATGFTYLGIDSVSASKGLYRSTDGTTWTEITPAGWPADFNRVVLDVAPSDQSVVYFLAETPESGLHVVYAGVHNWTSFWRYEYLSGDGSGAGGDWLDRTANLPSGGTGGTFAHQRSYDLVVKVKPDEPDVVFIGGVNMYRSLDGFATSSATTWVGGWSLTGSTFYPNHHPDLHAIVFDPVDPGVMYTASDGGVHRTADDLAVSISWSPLNDGYLTSQFYTLALDHATPGNDILVGGLQDNGTTFTNSPDPAAPWGMLAGGDGAYCAIAGGRTSYYTSFQNGIVYRRLVDDSGTVTASTRVDPIGVTSYLFINPFVLDADDNDMMYLAGGTEVWRNSDLTAIPLSQIVRTSVNWNKLTNTTVGSGAITALEATGSPARRLYYGTSTGSVYRLVDPDTGNPVPVNVTGGSFPAGANVSCIAADPVDPERALVVFSNYNVVSLWYTTDGGTTWTDVSGNLEEFPNGSGRGPSCRWAEIVPGVGAFVGTSTGLYATALLDGASTLWAQEGSATIGNAVVDMMEVRLSDGLLVAATHGSGVYSANLGSVSLPVAVLDRWNLVSVPMGSTDYSKESIFPTAMSSAFAYAGGYAPQDTLQAGLGYWLLFDGAQNLLLTGTPTPVDTVDVVSGWNLVGSISDPVAAGVIVSIPPGIVVSPFYGYDHGYSVSTTIEPGRGYWVKVSEAGKLILEAAATESR